MAYLYKKRVGTKEYYYLRVSERKGGKVIAKDVAYLGSSLEKVKTALDNLPTYASSIRKAYKTIHNFLESNRYLEKVRSLKLKKDEFLGEVQLEVEACKLHYQSEFHKQQVLTREEILKNFIIEFAYNTTAIEGNTIKLAEARNLLEDGLTPKNKSLREIYDVQNTEKVFVRLMTSHQELSHDFITGVHKELMGSIDVRVGYRTHDVRVIKANFKATPAPYVKTDMELLLKWYREHRTSLHPLVLATLFHHKFEKIHPFMDGNGRTGRMLLNYLLLKNDYPPTVIKTRARAEYLRALRDADPSDLTKIPKDAYQRLVQFVAEQLITSYWNIFL